MSIYIPAVFKSIRSAIYEISMFILDDGHPSPSTSNSLPLGRSASPHPPCFRTIVGDIQTNGGSTNEVTVDCVPVIPSHNAEVFSVV